MFNLFVWAFNEVNFDLIEKFNNMLEIYKSIQCNNTKIGAFFVEYNLEYRITLSNIVYLKDAIRHDLSMC